MKSAHFLGWENTLCTQVAKYLLEEPERLQSKVFVPTKESAVRLKEELLFQSGNSACFIPNIAPLSSLFSSDTRIDASIELAAWIEILLTSDVINYSNLFPVQPQKQDIVWATNLAQQFLSVQRSFDDYAITPDVLYEKVTQTASQHEAERWADWFSLLNNVNNLLITWGYTPSHDFITQTANELRLLQEFANPSDSSVILAGIPELTYYEEQYLTRCEEAGVHLDILIHAPEQSAEHFDSWGRPSTDFWTKCPIPLKPDQITLLQDSYLIAEQTCELTAQEYMKSPNAQICLGACTSELAPLISDAFAQHDWQIYNPAGVPFTHSGLYLLIKQFANYCDDPQAFESFYMIAQSGIMAYSLSALDSFYHCVKMMDELKGTHLPETINFTLALLSKKKNSTADYATNLNSWLIKLNQEGLIATNLLEWVDSLRNSGWEDGFQGKALDLLEEKLTNLKTIQEHSQGWATNEAILQLLLSQLQNARMMVAQNEHDTLKINGWLELPYCRESSLIITGMYAGSVPEGKPDDAYLPESLKQALHLPSLESTNARDSYLFSSMVMGRKKNGTLHILISKNDSSSDPLRPSPLLMRCADKDLATRVQTLFGEASEYKPTIKFSRGNWILRYSSNPSISIQEPSPSDTLNLSQIAPDYINPWSNPEKHFSPSLLKNYLACPLRFWLARIFDMHDNNRPSLEVHSLEANSSGSFIHKILEQFAQDFPNMKYGLDKEKMQARMGDLIAQYQYDLLSDRPLLPVVMQMQSIKKRLKHYINYHIQQLQNGWECLEFETHHTLNIQSNGENFQLKMVVDRVDIHPEKGYRIIDYKTGNLKKFNQACASRIYDTTLEKLQHYYPNYTPYTEQEGKRLYMWTDLQLPIYTQWAKSHYNTNEVQAGYCNLPANTDDIGFNMWTELTEERQDEAAYELALMLMARIRKGTDIYAMEDLKGSPPTYDVFEELRPDSIWEMSGLHHNSALYSNDND